MSDWAAVGLGYALALCVALVYLWWGRRGSSR